MNTQTSSSTWASGIQDPKPSAYITKRKQRLPQLSNGLIYLKDQDEFEIEIFNPLQNYILAKIKIGGKYISGNGIVLRPGERIFLERFLDTNAKFTFNTYTVENSREARYAILINGYVEVEFYGEEIYTPYTQPIWNQFNSTGINLGINGNISSPYGLYISHTPTGTNITSTPLNASSFTNCSNNSCNTVSEGHITNYSSVETGTVEKGKESGQHFESINKDFLAYSFHNIAWQILPESQRLYSSKDLKQYCSNCGAKIKKSTYKFCPHCGEKIN